MTRPERVEATPPVQTPRIGRDRAERLLASMGSKRLLVVGDLILDRYLRGRVDRISPEAPVPVLRVESCEDRPGGAANVAANAAALGATVELLGCVGADDEAGILSDALRRRGIGVEGVVTLPERATSVKTRLVSMAQQLARFDRELDDPLPDGATELLREGVERALERADAIAIEDYDKGVLTPRLLRFVMERALAGGVPVVVDPKRRHFFQCRGATLFKPNLRELSDAFGGTVRHDRDGWLEKARRRTGVEHLLLTLGEEGMLLKSPRTAPIHFPATARAVYDVSGAGDTATAVLALALAAGATPVEAALLANHAAGLEVEKAGASTVTPEELLEALPQ